MHAALVNRRDYDPALLVLFTRMNCDVWLSGVLWSRVQAPI